MKRLQIYLPEELLYDLRLYAKSRNIPLAEAIREAGREFSAKPRVRMNIQKVKNSDKTTKNPFLAIIGMLGKGPSNASTTVDDIYD